MIRANYRCWSTAAAHLLSEHNTSGVSGVVGFRAKNVLGSNTPPYNRTNQNKISLTSQVGLYPAEQGRDDMFCDPSYGGGELKPLFFLRLQISGCLFPTAVPKKPDKQSHYMA